MNCEWKFWKPSFSKRGTAVNLDRQGSATQSHSSAGRAPFEAEPKGKFALLSWGSPPLIECFGPAPSSPTWCGDCSPRRRVVECDDLVELGLSHNCRKIPMRKYAWWRRLCNPWHRPCRRSSHGRISSRLRWLWPNLLTRFVLTSSKEGHPSLWSSGVAFSIERSRLGSRLTSCQRSWWGTAITEGRPRQRLWNPSACGVLVPNLRCRHPGSLWASAWWNDFLEIGPDIHNA